MSADTLDDLHRRRLRWRTRRGLLENDLILTRFLDRYASELDAGQLDALNTLLDQTDNDLLDLLLARTEPAGVVDTAPVRSLLALMRSL
jgi:antitoxin CptB